DRVGFDGLRIGVPDTPKSRTLGLGEEPLENPRSAIGDRGPHGFRIGRSNSLSLCKASEAKLNHRRDLQEVQLARTSIYIFLTTVGTQLQKQVAVNEHPCCLRYVSALDICVMSFGDAGTVSARIADQADYGLLNPASSRRAQESTTRPSPSSHATYKMGDSAEISAGVQRKF
ncbi:hypothetical protein Prudu_83S000200, partial [Prunus dulcis]